MFCNGEGIDLCLLRGRNCVLYVFEIETSRGYKEEASSKSSCVLLMCENAACVSDFVCKLLKCCMYIVSWVPRVEWAHGFIFHCNLKCLKSTLFVHMFCHSGQEQ